MKKILEPKILPFWMLGMGVVALGLRFALYAVAVDEKNLLTSGHPLEILLWLLTAAALALVIAAVRPLDGSNRYEDNFGPSAAGAVGSFALAAGILLSVVFSGTGAYAGLNRLRNLLGYLAAASLVAVGVCRLRGRQPFFGFHGLVCLFFAIHMVSRYQTWSGNPQLQDYAFSLGACVALMLFAFYQTAFEVGSGRRRMQLGTGLMALYLCIGALYGAECPLICVTGGVWAVTNLCPLRAIPESKENEPEDAPPEKE